VEKITSGPFEGIPEGGGTRVTVYNFGYVSFEHPCIGSDIAIVKAVTMTPSIQMRLRGFHMFIGLFHGVIILALGLHIDTPIGSVLFIRPSKLVFMNVFNSMANLIIPIDLVVP
jgi:hypothetical protein